MSGIIRTEPHTEVDLRLLEYMKSMVKSSWISKPVMFPLPVGHSVAFSTVLFPSYKQESDTHGGRYFLLGYGLKAVVCWTTGRLQPPFFSLLNSDAPPSKEQIDAYRVGLEGEESDECEVGE